MLATLAHINHQINNQTISLPALTLSITITCAALTFTGFSLGRWPDLDRTLIEPLDLDVFPGSAWLKELRARAVSFLQSVTEWARDDYREAAELAMLTRSRAAAWGARSATRGVPPRKVDGQSEYRHVCGRGVVVESG